MEILDIVDENGEPTGRTVDRETAHREGILHRTAHLWIFQNRNGKPHVLLQKRSSCKDSHPGCYDISSAGHIPAGCGYIESALRELKEELGLSAHAGDLIFCGSRRFRYREVFHGKPFFDNQFTKVFAVWMDIDIADVTVQPEEVESVRWMDFEQCIEGVEQGTFNHCIAAEELYILKKALFGQ